MPPGCRGPDPPGYRRTRILLDLGEAAEAVRAADAGLLAVPGSSRLLVAKADAQERLGWWYELRHTLRAAAASNHDPQLLRRYAEVEDSYGRDASPSYQMLAEALEKTAPGPEVVAALDRGFQVSLRDDDLSRARWFAARLGNSGRQEYAALLSTELGHDAGSVQIPGGMKALMFVARGKEQSDRKRFFARYGRTLLDYLTSLDDKVWQFYVGVIEDHFRRVVALESYGWRTGAKVSIVLSLQDANSRKTAEEVLRLFGWKLQAAKSGVRIEGAAEGSAADRRVFGTSLGIDEIAMVEALKSGRSFTIEVTDDEVPVAFGEDFWRV